MTAITDIRNRLEQEKGKKAQLKLTIKKLKKEKQSDAKLLKDLEKAREIIRTVGHITQEQLRFHFEDITSLALESIFPEPYKLVLNFVERRSKTECDIMFERDGYQIKPTDNSGIGSVDVAAFALRIAAYAMQNPKTRKCIILDEPMRFLSAAYHEAASEMLKEVSTKMGLQFIIVTHNEAMSTFADKVFKVSKRTRSKVSKVQIVYEVK